ncbi:YgiT-type zinc finger protein [Savagea serpentis]|nr:YgiT-type zinc finger protein [Savagea serpentis]
MPLERFYEINEPLSIDTCPKCSKKVELIFNDYKIKIDEYTIEVKDLPQLECANCSHQVLSSKSKQLIMYLYQECKARNQLGVQTTPKKLNKRYGFCERFNFNYDYRDYENIPGLTGLANDGFLTPVFFKKEALIYFMHHPEYELNLFSESYGVFGYKDEFEVPFGLNKNDKLILWLVDLEKLDDSTLKYLEIHNVASDHIIMDTSFYDAQLNVIWSEPIIERQIINLRNKAYDLLTSKHGIDLHHLEGEVIKSLEDIEKPILYNENEIKSVISALHKILIEAVNTKALKTYYESVVDKKEKSYKEWGSIKYYEFLLTQFSAKPVRELIAPLYLLNDLRIIFFHLLSSEREEKLKQNVITTLGLTSFNIKEIYLRLNERLKELFEELTIALEDI